MATVIPISAGNNMEELNACTMCGFTTRVIEDFTSHIEQHEQDNSRSSSGELSTHQTQDWIDQNQSPTPSPPSTPPTASPNSEPKTDQIRPDMTAMAAAGKGSKTTHVCPHCNFTTFMSQHMRSHLEAHERHQGQMYKCDICFMQFSQKANMHRHRMRHSGFKPYECRFCQKRFFRKDQMQEHSMTHIKTGCGFDCPVDGCKLNFSQHSHLRTHLDESHTISAASPASCKRCSLLFANSRRLLLHYQTRHDEINVRMTPGLGEIAFQTELESPKAVAPKIPPVKRKRTGTLTEIHQMTNDMVDESFTEHLQRMVKKELSPPNTDTSDNSTTPEYEHTINYPMTSQDLLMMCLTGATNLQQQLQLQASVIQEEKSINSVIRTMPKMDSLPKMEIVPKMEIIETTQEPEQVATTSEEHTSECEHCLITFHDNTMFLLHKGLHTDGDPWRCNLCGMQCCEKYMFTTHLIFADHSTTTSAMTV